MHQPIPHLEQLRRVVTELKVAGKDEWPAILRCLKDWATPGCDVGRPDKDFKDPEVVMRWYAGQLLELTTMAQGNPLLNVCIFNSILNTFDMVEDVCTTGK